MIYNYKLGETCIVCGEGAVEHGGHMHKKGEPLTLIVAGWCQYHWGSNAIFDAAYLMEEDCCRNGMGCYGYIPEGYKYS